MLRGPTRGSQVRWEYGTGTEAADAVTINAPAGVITLSNSHGTLASNAEYQFALNNSLATVTPPTVFFGTPFTNYGKMLITLRVLSPGFVLVSVRNIHTAAVSIDGMVIHFVMLRMG